MLWALWFFPIALTLHNIEEAIWLPEFSGRAGIYFRPVGRLEFCFAMIPVTLLGWCLTWALWHFGRQSLGCYLFFSFALMMAINVIFPHAVATIALRKYCPGLITGAVCVLPTSLYLLIFGYVNGYYTASKLCVVMPIFAAVILGCIILLFRIGRWTSGQWRLRDN